MKIKMKLTNGGCLYSDKIPHTIRQYNGTFWYFVFGAQGYSYSDGLNYEFKSCEDVEKLIENMIVCEAHGTWLYDLDAHLKDLDIKLYKERG